MSKWAASIRGKDGQLETVVIEAESKAEVFAELKKRGINSIVRVEQTNGKVKPRKSASARSSGKSLSLVKGIIAGVIVVMLAVVIYQFLAPRQPQSNEKPAPKAPKISDAKPPKPSAKKDVRPVPVEKPRPNIEKIDGRMVNHDLRKSFVSTNPPTMRGPADRYRRAIEEGRRPLFSNPCDLVLSQYAIPGEISPPPPITPDLKNAFVQSTFDKIEITDEDSPRDRAIKEGVMALREELREWVKDGGDFETYMAKLQSRQEQESFYVSEVRSTVEKEFRETGNIENTLELWRKYNEKLEADGLRKTSLPPAVRVYFLKNKMEVPEE